MVAAGVAIAATAGFGWAQGWRTGVLLGLGLVLGAVLWGAAFSFAAAWRAVLEQRRTAGLRAQFLLAAGTAAMFLPALAAGQVLGQPVRGFVFPMGYALAAGAFMFGFGMQLGGGCGSGTLAAAGAGAGRSWLTLAGFVGGATFAARTSEIWAVWPMLPAVSLPARFGTLATVAGVLAVFGLLYGLAWWVERRRHGAVVPIHGPAVPGRMSLGAGAVALSLAGFATLVVAGRPWTITAAFPLWGSRAIAWTGADDPAFWRYWEEPTRVETFLNPLASNATTVMDIGVIAGSSLIAWGWRRRAEPWRGPWVGPAVAALLGGTLMGAGAVMATGCNISGFLAGVASGSLHGWVWFGVAFCGTAAGLPARRLFGPR